MDKAVKIMNRLGKDKTPFLFIIDFDMKEPKIILLDDLQNSEEILFDIAGKKNHTS